MMLIPAALMGRLLGMVDVKVAQARVSATDSADASAVYSVLLEMRTELEELFGRGPETYVSKEEAARKHQELARTEHLYGVIKAQLHEAILARNIVINGVSTDTRMLEAILRAYDEAVGRINHHDLTTRRIGLMMLNKQPNELPHYHPALTDIEADVRALICERNDLKVKLHQASWPRFHCLTTAKGGAEAGRQFWLPLDALIEARRDGTHTPCGMKLEESGVVAPTTPEEHALLHGLPPPQ